MRLTLLPVLLPAFAYVGVVGCSAEDPNNPPGSQETDSSANGVGSEGTSGGPTTGAFTSNTAGPTVGSTTNAVNSTTSGSSSTTAAATNGGPLGSTVSGSTTSGTTNGGVTNGGVTNGGPTTGGFTMGGITNGGPTTGGFTTASVTTAGAGGAGNTTGATTGTSTTGGTPEEPDCNAAMPTNGQDHSGNSRGGSGNLAWEIWSNTGEGELTTFEGVAAFRASWNNAGGYLGRMGFEWGNNGEPYTAHGRIHAQFVSRKDEDGSGGGYSYVGMYGWTLNPCVEWYVIEDTFNTLPFNPGGTVDKGQVTIDGGTYQIYTRDTTGTGGSRCGDVSNWIQYYSIRTSPRSCGLISLSDHFDAWEEKGMSMAGNLLEAKILAEVGGGVGYVDFPIANVTTTQ